MAFPMTAHRYIYSFSFCRVCDLLTGSVCFDVVRYSVRTPWTTVVLRNLMVFRAAHSRPKLIDETGPRE